MQILIFILLLIFSSGFTYTSSKNELTLVETEEDKAQVSVNEVEDFSKGKRMFIATNEWQEIEDDQMIPPGLHIRLNMETGTKEAKLLEQDNNDDNNNNNVYHRNGLESINGKEEESLKGVKKVASGEPLHKGKNGGEMREDYNDDFKYWNFGGQKGVLREGKDNFTMDELKKALKNFKQTDQQQQQQDDMNLRFRSMNEMKKEFEVLNMTIKSDFQVLRDMIEQFKWLQIQCSDESQSCVSDKVTLLKELEYYLHQIDNANMLVDDGGLEVMWAEMEGGGEEVRVSVLLNIAAISQSNPHAQVVLLKSSILEGILNILINTTSSSSFSPFPPLQLTSLSALSAAIRGFPLAQQLVAKQQGYAKLVNIVSQHFTHLQNNNSNNNNNHHIKSFMKFTKRFIHLITDIWQERVYNGLDEQISKEVKEQKAEQYERVGLLEQLTASDWCDLIGGLFVNVTELDYREAMLKAMQAFSGVCPSYKAAVHQQLQSFLTQLEQLMDRDDDNTYLKDLYPIVQSILNKTSHGDL